MHQYTWKNYKDVLQHVSQSTYYQGYDAQEIFYSQKEIRSTLKCVSRYWVSSRNQEIFRNIIKNPPIRAGYWNHKRSSDYTVKSFAEVEESSKL